MKKSNFYLITVGLLLLAFVAVASVSAASITVTSPNGGETWQRGTPNVVRWSYTDFPAGAPVKLVLVKANTEIGTIVASTSIGIGGSGSYTWDISPDAGLSTGSEFKVRVQSLSQPTVKDTSNAVFTLTPAGTTVPSITVTAPNGGETWQRGTSHTVTWSFTGSPGSYVKIVLVKANVETGTIIASTSLGSGGKGSYTWDISPDAGLSTGSEFKVRVQSLSQPTVKDTSNAVFTLTPAGTTVPSITVTAPNGGETWQRGTTRTIYYEYSGSVGSYVKIVLIKGSTDVGTIEGSVPICNTGKCFYNWEIASTGSTGSEFKVRVQSLSQPTISDTSNNYFTLTPTGKPSSITVTAPNGGETWQRGTTRTVTWDYTGSPGSTVKIVLVKGGIEAGGIADSVPMGIGTTGGGGSGSYTWLISASGLTGDDFTVSVQSINQPTLKDASNAYFTLIPATTLPSLSSIWPSEVNTNTPVTDITYYIYGSGFQSGAQVSFMKSLCIGCTRYYGTKVITLNPGTTILCSLPTEGIPVGYYDLYVRNPGGNWVSKQNALKVYYQ